MPQPRPPRHEAGFTLVELLVATALTAMFIVIILNMLEASARTTNVQTDLAELQQAQRIAQHDLTRMFQMAGRGGLPVGQLPTGLAIEVLDNAGANAHINPGDTRTPEVLDGTDVLVLRGVFESPVFQLLTDTDATNPAPNVAFDTGDASTATAGTISLTDPSPSGIPQSLDRLIEAIDGGRNEAVVLISPLADQIFAVVELDASSSSYASDHKTVNLSFFISGGTNSATYADKFNGNVFPANLISVSHLAVLEEYRYYIREVRSADGDLFPSLSRARVYPGTQVPYGGDAVNWSVDVVDNAVDLQAAIGVDTDEDGRVDDARLTGVGEPDDDEWLFNHADDDPEDAKWNAGKLSFLRVSTILRSARRDYRNEDPNLDNLENHEYTSSSPLNDALERQYYRRTLSTTVDLRNL